MLQQRLTTTGWYIQPSQDSLNCLNCSELWAEQRHSDYSSGRMCSFDPSTGSAFHLSWQVQLVLKVSPWATGRAPNNSSVHSLPQQTIILLGTEEQSLEDKERKAKDYWRKETAGERGKTKAPRKNFETTFSPARIQASSLQLALFTSSNSDSTCFEVLLHFFLWEQKSQQLKQNREWENPKIEIITNQRRGLYMGWWSHWPALPSNFSSCQLWWVLYF